MSIFDFLILGLATWRLSSLLVKEDGPWGLLARLRHLIGVRYDEMSNIYGTNIFARLLTCLWCTSMWVALILFAGYHLASGPTMFVNSVLALSAIAILIEKVICGSRN